MKRIRVWVIFFILIAIPVAFISRMIYQHYLYSIYLLNQINEGHSVSSMVQNIPHADAVILWKSLPYESIKDTPGFKIRMANMRTVFSTIITPDQDAKLKFSLYNIIEMWSSKDMPDKYLEIVKSFKPVRCVIDTAELNQDAAQLGLSPQDSSSYNVVKAVIHRLASGPELKGICIPASSVTYVKYNKLSKPYFPINNPHNLTNVSKLGVEHGLFIYQDNFLDNYNIDKSISVAEIHLYLQGRENNTSGPYILRMWWSEKEKNWLPLELVSGTDSSDLKLFLP